MTLFFCVFCFVFTWSYSSTTGQCNVSSCVHILCISLSCVSVCFLVQHEMYKFVFHIILFCQQNHLLTQTGL